MSAKQVNTILRFGKRSCLGAAAWAACGWYSLGAPVAAQSPAAPHIEMYYGLRRVDVSAPAKVAASPAPAAPQRTTTAVLREPEQKPLGSAGPLLPDLSAAPFLAPGPRLDRPAATGVVPVSHVEGAVPVPAVPARLPEAPPPAVVARTESPPAPAAPKHREPRPHVEDNPSSSGAALYHIAVAQLICTLVAVVVGPLLVVLTLCALLRRHSRRHGPLIRIEFANGQFPTYLAMPPAPAAPPRVETVPASTAIEESPSTAETFDLGPTYDDELRMKEQSLRQQEQAIVQQLFEQNVKLQEDLGQLELAGV